MLVNNMADGGEPSKDKDSATEEMKDNDKPKATEVNDRTAAASMFVGKQQNRQQMSSRQDTLRENHHHKT